MKNPIYLLLLFLFPSLYTYGQEEFFGKQNGLSLSYLKGFNSPVNALGFSFYSKKGILGGLGFETIENETFPLASILFYPALENSSSVKFCYGASYSYIENLHVVGLNWGLIKCFFPEANFPFSLNGSFSAQTGFGNNQGIALDVIPVLGCGYTQTFFAHSIVYPFIGISNAYDFGNKNNLFSVHIGINIKIVSNSDKTNK